MYPTEQSLVEFAATIEGNKSLAALSGPTHGTDVLGGRLAYELWNTGIMLAVMTLLAVPRHTRAEEETDRLELLRATVIGRHSMSAASFGVASSTSIIIGLGVALALIVQGLESGGSLILGASFASLGMVFAAVGLLTSQITHHARSAKGFALTALGAAFAVRAVGDTGTAAVSMFSPIGWMHATQPFAGNHWWAVALSLLATALITGLAIGLEARRDLGAGLVPVKPGPATAPESLSSFLGLSWRLHRGPLAAWSIGAFSYAAAMGSVLNSFEDIIGDNEEMLDYLPQAANASLNDLFLAALLSYFALLAMGYGISAVLKLRSEETFGRLELLLSYPRSRRSWMLSHLVFAMLGSLVVMTAAGAGLGLTYSLTGGGAEQLPRTLLASLAYFPPVAVLVGVTAASFGLVPRVGQGVWAIMIFTVFIAIFSQVIDLPEWVRGLSPLHHVGAVPAEATDYRSLAILLAISIGLLVVGLAGFDRRDSPIS